MTGSAFPDRVDLLVIGGGITGAGVACEAARTGARVMLVEAGDFASGTSSRSSKLVHGGLRYLKNYQWRLTLESVRERERLMRQLPGLVTPQRFIMPLYDGASPSKRTMQLGLWLYDRMAGQGRSRFVDVAPTMLDAPGIRGDGLIGSMQYLDAQTDDARLVWRVLQQATARGATCLNYARVTELTREGERVTGAVIDIAGIATEVRANVVVDASGAWAGSLDGAGTGAPSLRPLRGSHFLFPTDALPVFQAVSWLHPADGRPVFAYPWEGAVLYGTTDLDHGDGDLWSPRMAAVESDYLLDGLRWMFPGLAVNAADALSSYAGVRPVVSSGQAAPSDESRESASWAAPGLIGMTGGKLTTFRVTARQVLQQASRMQPALKPAHGDQLFDPVNPIPGVPPGRVGRLGPVASTFHAEMPADEFDAIDRLPYCRAELRWAARHEKVQHLDDLLLRRTRLGLVAADGGRAYLDDVLSICKDELAWDDARCAQERSRYEQLWTQQHAPQVDA